MGDGGIDVMVWLSNPGSSDAGVAVERVAGGGAGAEGDGVVRSPVGAVRPADGQRSAGRHSQRDHLHGGRDDPRLPEQPRAVWRGDGHHPVTAQDGAGYPPHVDG